MTDVSPDNPPRKRGPLRTVVIVVAAAAALVVTLYIVMITFVARPYLIPSESMAPTLNPGDHVMVNKFKYHLNSPQAGDVIVFTAPPEWSVGYQSIRSENTAVRWLQNALSVFGLVPPDENQAVKRIIAVGGQTVECRSGTGLTVDGKPVSEPYLDPATMSVDPQVYSCLGPEFGPVEVPDGRLWVMGDNRTHSADSRVHCTNMPADFQRGLVCTGDPMAGTIPVDNVVGEVSHR